MNVALIPVRGGSKSIPFKNIKPICGQPLVYWTMKASCECSYIDVVYVATDSDRVRDTALRLKNENKELFHKIEVIGRSSDTASDTASTESVMLEFAGQYAFDNIVLIQATSPLLTADDLKGGFEIFMQPDTDSVLSCVRQRRFLWERKETGDAIPLNYDVYHRPRRQEFSGYLMENGAFYITSKEKFLASKNRISGNIKAYEMSEDTAYELDEASDWIIIEELLRRRERSFHKIEKPKEIKMFLTDCDGCLTDGGMYYSEKGDELKKFNTKDGMGFSLLRERGIITGIITGENTRIAETRAKKLHIDELHQGVGNKLDVVKRLAEKYRIDLTQIAYVGDDINDMDVLKNVGFPCTVNNASASIKKKARYVSGFNGGDGAIRDIIEFILHEDEF
ncbi:MAG: acylneuraminate cytidylyltransferase [Eubacterium sp.]|nr:acylneuraminate cytidylyltransferase [Eubacterium sp.]